MRSLVRSYSAPRVRGSASQWARFVLLDQAVGEAQHAASGAILQCPLSREPRHQQPVLESATHPQHISK